MTSKKSDTTTPADKKPRAPRTKKASRSAAPARSAAPKASRKAAPAPAAASDKPLPTHEEIAARAREIWREKGGTSFENWIQAERELSR